MPFRNSVVGGTTLVRPAIKSPNYVPGVSGWSINIDGSAEFNDVDVRGTLESTNYVPGVSGWHLDQTGSAEFNDVTIRGSTQVGGDILMYDGAPAVGTLAFTISQDGGTDQYGNTYPDGLRSRDTSGAQQHQFLRIDKFGNINFGRDTWDNTADVFITADAINMNSPWNDSGTKSDPITMHFYTGDADGTPRAIADFGAFLNGQDIDLQVYGTLLSTPVTTSSTGVLVNAPTGQTGSLLSLRVNGDSKFTVDADGILPTYADNAFTAYTPAVSGGGTVTWTTRTGWWQRVGKMIYFNAYLVVNAAGSTASSFMISAPVSIDRTTRQNVSIYLEGLTGGSGSGQLVSLTGGSGASFDRTFSSTGAIIQGQHLAAGAVLTATGWIREA